MPFFRYITHLFAGKKSFIICPFLNQIWMLFFSHLKIADFESLKIKIKGTDSGRVEVSRTCPTTSIWLQVYDTLFYDLIKSV